MNLIRRLVFSLFLLQSVLGFQPKKHVLGRPFGTNLLRSDSTKKHGETLTQLQAIPPSAWWSIGHAAGGSLGVPIIAGASRKGGWYRKIDLPSWTPPDAVFGPVWTTLYVIMGLAASKIYYSKPVNKLAMTLWWLHCALNLSWAPVFFGMQRLRLGMLLNATLLVSLLAILPVFYAIQPLSAYLLLPYLAWLTVANCLNKAICRLNPTKQGYNNAMLQADLIKLQNEAAKYAGV